MDFDKDKENNNLPFSGSNLSLKIKVKRPTRKTCIALNCKITISKNFNSK